MSDAIGAHGVQAALPASANAAAGNAGPRTSKTAWTDAAAVAIFMMRLSKRAPGADIADREAR